MHDNTKGALLMMGSMAGYTFNDACMKLLSPDMPLFQAIFLRGFGVCIVFAAIILFRRQRIGAIGRRDIGFVSLRALCEAAATYLFLSALFRMPIANATAIIQALPLTVTLAGAVFLGEKVGWRRWLAIVAGFAGILLIVRPSTEGFDTASLYALCAVGVITARDLLTRQLSPAVPSLHVAAFSALVITMGAGLFAASQPTVPVAAPGWALLAGAVLTIIMGYLFSVMVMRVGDIGFVAPFRYTSLLWALVLGIALFGEWPDMLTLLGAAIVVASGLFMFYRERSLAT